MSLSAAEDDSGSEIHIPADIDWHMLDKSKFFFLGAALFSGLSAALYPIVVLKTRQQVSSTQISCIKMSLSIMRYEGFRGFYRGFGTSLMGTIPARALYMGALEVTKSSVGTATVSLGFSDTTATAIGSAAAGLSSAMAAQLVISKVIRTLSLDFLVWPRWICFSFFAMGTERGQNSPPWRSGGHRFQAKWMEKLNCGTDIAWQLRHNVFGLGLHMIATSCGAPKLMSKQKLISHRHTIPIYQKLKSL